jgi:hypothetical protein
LAGAYCFLITMTLSFTETKSSDPASLLKLVLLLGVHGPTMMAVIGEGTVLAWGTSERPMVELVRGSPGLSCLLHLVPSTTPGAPGASADTETPPAPPESPAAHRPWPGLDHLGVIQAGGGVILGLIALFSSCGHITHAGRSIGLQQQWGIPLIAASVATVVC